MLFCSLVGPIHFKALRDANLWTYSQIRFVIVYQAHLPRTWCISGAPAESGTVCLSPHYIFEMVEQRGAVT